MPEEQNVEVPPATGIRTLGRYTLLAQLAVGGMAEIFLARQHSLGGFEKILVVKKILESYAADPGFVSMFLDEARIAAQLNHPNIVQIFDLGQAESTYFIAMEYLAGESVSRLVRRATERGSPVPLHVTAQIVAQAADGLHYAHTATDTGGRPLHIVHRDISPQNLVVTYSGAVKIVDFGIALAANRSSQTDQGKVKGKLSYMSPEQARGLALDARSDVFALGVVLYEALTGTRLFKQEDPVKIFAQILSPAPLPRASVVNPEVPFELDEIVAGALRKNRDERYQTAGELRDALTAWLRQNDLDRDQSLADLMTELFSVEKERRLRVLDHAARGEEISSGALTGAGTERSMPDGVQPAPAPAVTKPRRPWWALGVGAGGLAAAAYFGLRAPEPLPAVTMIVPARAPVPPPPPASLDVTALPPGTHVLIDGTDRGASPVHLAAMTLGTHQVKLHLDGRSDFVQTVQIDRPGQSVDLRLEMPAVPAPSPPPAVSAPGSVSAVTPAPIPEKPPHGEKHRGASGQSGFLSLDCKPWAEVTIDGKAMGETPLIEVALSPGSHSVALANPDQNLSQTITVSIKSGETVSKQLKF